MTLSQTQGKCFFVLLFSSFDLFLLSFERFHHPELPGCWIYRQAGLVSAILFDDCLELFYSLSVVTKFNAIALGVKVRAYLLREPGLRRGALFAPPRLVLDCCLGKYFHNILPFCGLINLINHLFGIYHLFIDFPEVFTNFGWLTSVQCLRI